MEYDQALNIIGATRRTSKSELRKIFIQLARKWHPDRNDKNLEVQSNATAKTQEILTAYRILYPLADDDDPTPGMSNSTQPPRQPHPPHFSNEENERTIRSFFNQNFVLMLHTTITRIRKENKLNSLNRHHSPLIGTNRIFLISQIQMKRPKADLKVRILGIMATALGLFIILIVKTMGIVPNKIRHGTRTKGHILSIQIIERKIIFQMVSNKIHQEEIKIIAKIIRDTIQTFMPIDQEIIITLEDHITLGDSRTTTRKIQQIPIPTGKITNTQIISKKIKKESFERKAEAKFKYENEKQENSSPKASYQQKTEEKKSDTSIPNVNSFSNDFQSYDTRENNEKQNESSKKKPEDKFENEKKNFKQESSATPKPSYQKQGKENKPNTAYPNVNSYSYNSEENNEQEESSKRKKEAKFENENNNFKQDTSTPKQSNQGEDIGANLKRNFYKCTHSDIRFPASNPGSSHHQPNIRNEHYERVHTEQPRPSNRSDGYTRLPNHDSTSFDCSCCSNLCDCDWFAWKFFCTILEVIFLLSLAAGIVYLLYIRD